MRFCDDPLNHCLTCSDEAIVVRVLSIEAESGLAMVAVVEKKEGETGEMKKEKAEAVDVLLVEDVAVGDLLLVHGGVALARYGEENGDV